MNKDLRHPIDRTGLNLCKSVKHKKELVRKNLRHLRNLRDLNNMWFKSPRPHRSLSV
jgi:hypothetical protein